MALTDRAMQLVQTPFRLVQQVADGQDGQELEQRLRPLRTELDELKREVRSLQDKLDEIHADTQHLRTEQASARAKANQA